MILFLSECFGKQVVPSIYPDCKLKRMNLKLIIVLPLLLACSPNTKQTMEQKTSQSTDVAANGSPGSTSTNWEAFQELLRTELVKSKSPNFLIGSLLEELYIRNLVTASYRELTFSIPLDLHGYDCSAPDCYSTDLSFRFPHDHQLSFPDEFSFNIHEHGCVDSTFRASGTMKLV